MIKLLDRYLLKELMGPFLFGIIAFSAILAGSTVLFYLVGDAVKYGISLVDFLLIFSYKLPGILVFTFPMSTLLASIIVFSRLSSDSELIALRASGIGFYRLIAPVALFGLTISVITIAFNDVVVPRATNSAELLMQSYTNRDQPQIKARMVLGQKTFWWNHL